MVRRSIADMIASPRRVAGAQLEEVGARLTVKDRVQAGRELAAFRNDVDQVRRAQGRFVATSKVAETQAIRQGRALRYLTAQGARLNTMYAAAIPGSRRMGLALGATAGGLAFFARQGWMELQELNKVEQQTAARMQSTGRIANVTAAHIRRRSMALEDLSTIDENVIGSGQNMLLTFRNVRNEVGEGNRIFDRATKAALNLSAAGFGEMTMTAKMLGKVLNDPVAGISALSRAGVTFSDTQKETIARMVESNNILGAQKLVLEEIESQVGGSAKAYGDSIEGMGNRVKDAFGDLSRSSVTVLIPIVEKGIRPIAKWLGRVTDIVEKKGWSGVWERFAPDWLKDRIDEIGGAILGVLVPAIVAAGIAGGRALLPLLPFAALGALIAHNWDDIEPVLSAVAGWLGRMLGPLQSLSPEVLEFATVVIGGTTAAVMLVGGIQKVIGIFGALRAVMATNPFIIIVAAVIALTYLIVKNWDKISAWTKQAFGVVKNAISDAFSSVRAAIGEALGWILDKVVTFIDFWFNMAGKILTGADAAFGWLPGIGDDIGKLRDEFNETTDGIVADLRHQADEFRRWEEKLTPRMERVRDMWNAFIDDVNGGMGAFSYVPEIPVPKPDSRSGSRGERSRGRRPNARAFGGHVEAGRLYEVNERSRTREFFVPEVRGNIIAVPSPNDDEVIDTVARSSGGRDRRPLIVKVLLPNGRVLGQTVVDDIDDEAARK